MFHKSLKAAFAISILAGLCIQANAGEHERSEVGLRALLAYELAEVKSSSDLKKYQDRAGRTSPLEKLSPAAKSRFIESLSFSQNGLSQYRYDALQSELSASETYKVLRIFGAEQSAPFLHESKVKSDIDRGIATLRMAEDHKDAKCISHGTCETGWVGYICTSNC